MSRPQVAVFIDWENVFGGVVVDAKKLKQYLYSFGNVVVANCYMIDFQIRRDRRVSAAPTPKERQVVKDKQEADRVERQEFGLWAHLRNLGFRVRLKKAKAIQGSDKLKANVDVDLAVGMMLAVFSGKIDEVVLFAGDSDYKPVLDVIREPPHFVRVHVVARRSGLSTELRNAADRWVLIEEVIDQIGEFKPVESTVEVASMCNATIPELG